jgi:hypothetical protein
MSPKRTAAAIARARPRPAPPARVDRRATVYLPWFRSLARSLARPPARSLARSLARAQWSAVPRATGLSPGGPLRLAPSIYRGKANLQQG